MGQATSLLCRTHREGYHVELTLMMVLDVRRLVMKIERARKSVVALFGIACLTMFGPQAAQAQVKLEYKFPEGKKQTYKTTSRVRQLLTFMNNMEKESVLRQTKIWSRSFGKRRGDSTLPIEEKVESLRDEYTFPGGMKLTLDSSDPKVKIADQELAFLGDVFKLESTITYVVVLDGQAKVKAIEGTDQLKRKAESLGALIAREEFQDEIGTDRLTRKFEEGIHNFPDTLARTGEPWERSEILEINGKIFTVRKKYEYRSTEKRGDKTFEKISYKVLEIKYDQDQTGKLPVKVIKSDLKVESSEGTILFDREEGHVVNASDKIRVKGNMTYSGAGVDQTGAFDMNVDSNTQLQPEAK
jgi:Family of unknown function (DUF6263)